MAWGCGHMCGCPESKYLVCNKFQQEWSQGVHCGAVWRIRKKMPQTRCQKLPQRPLHQKRASPNFRLASAHYILNNTFPWKQCHVTTLSSSTNSVCSGQHVGHVRRSCTKIFFELVMLCLVFVLECIGKVIK